MFRLDWTEPSWRTSVSMESEESHAMPQPGNQLQPSSSNPIRPSETHRGSIIMPHGSDSSTFHNLHAQVRHLQVPVLPGRAPRQGMQKKFLRLAARSADDGPLPLKRTPHPPTAPAAHCCLRAFCVRERRGGEREGGLERSRARDCWYRLGSR